MATHIIAQVDSTSKWRSPCVILQRGSHYRGTGQAILRIKGSTAFEGVSLPTITPDPAHRFEPFPLTDIQQAYWIGRTGTIELSGVGTHGYAEQESDTLDLARFERAWRQVVDRHDMLRAVISVRRTSAILAEVPSYCIQTLDLRGKPAAEVNAALAVVRADMSHQLLPRIVHCTKSALR